jgi:hypothetical protein
MFQHVTVRAGDPTPVLMGGQGRRVTGKFVGLETWVGATYHFHPEAPHIGFGGDDASWKAFSQLRESPLGPLLFRSKQPINQDGTFSIEKMLPGDYQLFVSAPGFKNYAVYSRVKVGPELSGQKPADLDLGEIASVNKLAQPVTPAEEKPTEKPAEKPADKAPEKATETATKPAAARTVTIRGKVVDDATGEPIGRLITQAGKFDPADPRKVTWGYSEGRSSSRGGSFSATVRWADGWTVRILADGYVPQPVLTSAPPADKDEIEVTIRLKRGPMVRGVVLDHTGQPLADAAVFAIGPTGVNLAAGQVIGNEAKSARTDAAGRFELPVGEAKSVAVSDPSFDAWPAAIPATGDLTIRLPEPARVEIDLDIEGADKDSVIFYQLLTQGRPEFAGLQSTREVTIANPGKLTFAALPPGRYQFSRNVMNRVGELGFGGMLDRQFVELKAGEVKKIGYVREKGARVRGKVTWPAETKLMGTVISIRSEKAEKGPFDQHEWTTTYASLAAAEDGTFLTERIPPGTYLIEAAAYVPLTQEQRFRTGIIAPSLRAQARIEVPAEGELTVPDLVLKPNMEGE